MLLRRTLIPTLGQSLISESEMGISKRLFQMKLSDGAELEAFLLFDSNLGAKITVTIRGCHGENVLAEELAEAFRGLLEERGAVAMEEVG